MPSLPPFFSAPAHRLPSYWLVMFRPFSSVACSIWAVV